MFRRRHPSPGARHVGVHKAAESILDGTDYSAWFEREMAPEFRAASRLKTIFYALPDVLRKRLMSHPRVQRRLKGIFDGDQTCRDTMRALIKLPTLLFSRSL